ncbi:MAG: pyruvate kinase [Acidimicrobiia bacterium]|nr:pyruvate kinase [Acidimicrobiia bacterium]
MDRRTKIIATLGPATYSLEQVSALVEAGMDVARLNFSHGDRATHAKAAGWVAAASKKHERPVAVLQDIQGPKIRVGTFPDGEISLSRGDDVFLVPGTGESAPGEIEIGYGRLLDDVGEGDKVVLADGLIRLMVRERIGDRLRAEVRIGGVLRDNKGAALPDSPLQVPTITDKDRNDLEFGAELGVDYVAASFVRSSADIVLVAELAGGQTPVVAKLELAAAYQNLDDILGAADGLMVARGDLGVELPLEEIPWAQADILQRTNAAGLVSITATEMLESMTTSPRPTRAEVTDVTTAVTSGTDAVMLSAETAVGEFPIRTVEVMDTICREAEARVIDSPVGHQTVDFLESQRTFASATAKAAVEAAWNLGLDTIVAFTESGRTAQLISKYRPAAPIYTFTTDDAILRRMALYWGVIPIGFERRDRFGHMVAFAEKYLEKHEICRQGDGIVVVAGVPPNEQASTNIMKLHVVGERMQSGSDYFGRG